MKMPNKLLHITFFIAVHLELSCKTHSFAPAHRDFSTISSSRHSKKNDDDWVNTILDEPFFDPDEFDESDDSPLGIFANLVRNDYQLAETLYAGLIFVILIVFSQELLRMQLYGDAYVPFKAGGGGKGALF